MKILGISGSLQEISSNRALLAAASDLATGGMSVDEYRGIASLPHFNPRDGFHEISSDTEARARLVAVLEAFRAIGAAPSA